MAKFEVWIPIDCCLQHEVEAETAEEAAAIAFKNPWNGVVCPDDSGPDANDIRLATVLQYDDNAPSGLRDGVSIEDGTLDREIVYQLMESK